jgi:hypothetical protein
MLSNWNDWDNIEQKYLPIIIFGGDKAVFNNDFDSRNKFTKLVAAYDYPPVFKIQSLDGKHEIDRCFPLAYRLATLLEIEILLKTNPNI